MEEKIPKIVSRLISFTFLFEKQANPDLLPALVLSKQLYIQMRKGQLVNVQASTYKPLEYATAYPAVLSIPDLH